MKNWLPSLGLTLCASLAFAEPPAAPSGDQARAAASLVESQIVRPLAKVEARRKRFSRAAPVALERRVRILDELTLVDARGHQFVRFAIDVRRPFDEPDSWQQDVVLGCAYVADSKVFVERAGNYLLAKSVLGEKEKPVPDVCRPSSQLAQVISKKAL